MDLPGSTRSRGSVPPYAAGRERAPGLDRSSGGCEARLTLERATGSWSGGSRSRTGSMSWGANRSARSSGLRRWPCGRRGRDVDPDGGARRGRRLAGAAAARDLQLPSAGAAHSRRCGDSTSERSGLSRRSRGKSPLVHELALAAAVGRAGSHLSGWLRRDTGCRRATMPSRSGSSSAPRRCGRARRRSRADADRHRSRSAPDRVGANLVRARRRGASVRAGPGGYVLERERPPDAGRRVARDRSSDGRRPARWRLAAADVHYDFATRAAPLVGC